MFVVAYVIVIICRAFVFVPIEVTGNSMAPTLKQSDFVITEQFSEIKRFDMIVFHSLDGNTYVKRVIGLPGETIEYKNDVLYVNGKKIDEEYLEGIKKKKNGFLYTTDFNSKELLGVKKIPKNNYFVLGDNRRLSKDSRSFGTINSQDIIGKIRLIYYPLKDFKIF
ncbi:signal peptidase I [Vagococcus silagei]|uniref:Signal peptidase I n=1 Tax=Vagococcus silagei TaxID=2508885 RepID=A0A4S3B4U3_9ENTE|nr:signal peptidase I [Vagococcus silagei]THB60436.1 signal peptidase I [Vagococcus silagei]